MLRTKANIAGYQNQLLDVLSEYMENIAPIIGPTMKPIENAIPTKAIARALAFVSDTSVIMAMLNEIFPLLRPPTKRANTKIKKFDDIAHNTYENEIPIWNNKKKKLIKNCNKNTMNRLNNYQTN